MVEKKESPQSGTRSVKKRRGTQSRSKKKPVTIDLEAVAVKTASTTKSKAQADEKSNRRQTPGNKPTTAPSAGKKNPNATSATPTGAQAAKATMPVSDHLQKSGINIPPKSPSAAGPTKPKGAGFTGLITAGITGGAVSLLALFTLQQTGLLASNNSIQQSDLTESIAKLEGEVASLSSQSRATPQINLAPLNARLERLESAGKQDDSAKINQKKFAVIDEAVKRLNGTTARLENSISAGAAGENIALSAVSKRINAIEKTVEVVKTNQSAVEALKNGLSDLSKQIAALANTDNSIAKEARAELVEKMTILAVDLENAKDFSESWAASTNRQLAEMKNTLAEIGTWIEDLAPRLAALESTVSTLQKDELKVAHTMALTSLKSSIDAGGGFEEAFALFESFSTDRQSTAALKEFAATGVPSLSTISASFLKISDTIIAAAKPEINSGFAGKLFFNAKSLVRIKPMGAITGDSPEAIVSRIKAALEKHDLATALDEWATLPIAAKNSSQDWFKKANARHRANTLIDHLLKQFMAGISGNSN